MASGFNPENYANFQRYQKMVADNPGKSFYSTMDKQFNIADPYQNRNPSSPFFGTGQGNDYSRPANTRSFADESGRLTTEAVPEYRGFYSDANPLYWDTNKFGNERDWQDTDVLPNGLSKTAYLDQIKNFQQPWGNVSSRAYDGGGIGGFLKEAISSPGIAPVLMAAGAGQLLGGGGLFSGTGSGVTGSFADFLADAAAQDMFAGGNAFGSLGGAGGGLGGAASDAAGGGINFGPPGTFTPPNATVQNGLGSFTNGTFNLPSLPSLPGASGSGTNFGPPGTFTPPNATVDNGLGSLVPGGAASAATGAGSALQRFLDGSATAADKLGLLGTIGATGLSMFSADRANDLQVEDRNFNRGIGAPSRARYEGSFAPGFTMANEPGYKDALDSSSDSLLRRLSATSGNPFQSPGGLIEANKQINSSLALPALQNYRNQNAATGGFGAFNSAAPGSSAAAIDSSQDVLTNFGGGLNQILNPKPPALNLADILKQLRQSGLV